jgi:hypothetical protein
MNVFAVLGWAEKEKSPQKEELTDVCFRIVVVAREGKNGPQKERTKNICFAVSWRPEKEKMAHKKKN